MITKQQNSNMKKIIILDNKNIWSLSYLQCIYIDIASIWSELYAEKAMPLKRKPTVGIPKHPVCETKDLLRLPIWIVGKISNETTLLATQ